MLKLLLPFLVPMILAQDKVPGESSVVAAAPATEEMVDHGWREIEMPFTKQNLQVPRELWRVIGDLLVADKVSEEIRSNYAVYPTSMTVEMSKVDQGVTKDAKNYRVTFVEGGGELDLFDYLDGQGKFQLRISPQIVNGKTFHLLYVSESPGRVIGDVKWGNGCGNIIDLTKSAGKLLESGLLVTTAKHQYLHLLAGYYIIFQLVDERMLLGYIRIKDSRYPQFSCTL